MASEKVEDYRINGGTTFSETGVEGAQFALERAHALLNCMMLDPKEFSALNADIQYRALEGIEYLVSVAHYQLRNV